MNLRIYKDIENYLVKWEKRLKRYVQGSKNHRKCVTRVKRGHRLIEREWRF